MHDMRWEIKPLNYSDGIKYKIKLKYSGASGLQQVKGYSEEISF